MVHRKFIFCALAIILVLYWEKATVNGSPREHLFPYSSAGEDARVRRATPSDSIAAYIEDLLGDEKSDTKVPEDYTECGIVDAQASPLITLGEKTEGIKWPWHIALYYYKSGVHSYKCGGTLIGRRTVITAAHCVQSDVDGSLNPDIMHVYLGKNDLKSWKGVQEMKVEKVLVHPEFKTEELKADLAILTLSNSADYTSSVRPVCLWEEKLSIDKGIPGTVIGWGYDENGKVKGDLRLAKMPIVSAITCIRSYPEFFGRLVDERKFCAGFRNGSSACNGDSGGGMVFPVSDDARKLQKWYLRGIVSVGPGYMNTNVCDPNHYVIFTDAAKFMDWIKENLM